VEKLSVDDLIDGERDQDMIRRILMKDISARYGITGFETWMKNYQQEPSYKTTRIHYNELMADKHIRVYELSLEELNGGEGNEHTIRC